MGKGTGSLRPAHCVRHRSLNIGWIESGWIFQRSVNGLEVTLNDHKQVVEVVSDTAAELPDRFQPLRSRKLISRRLQGKLGFSPLSHISGDLCKAYNGTVAIAYSVHDRQRPKLAAIFPDTPAFAFEATMSSGFFQRSIWKAALTIFIGEKPMKALAHYFVCSVAFESRSARVPTYDMSVEIENVNGVVNHALDQQLQTLAVF
jgi:hypothetical protein